VYHEPVYELRLPKGVGHEQRGRRLGVVVQSDALLPRQVVLDAPTSTSARSACATERKHHRDPCWMTIGHRSTTSVARAREARGVGDHRPK
jgi:mRNA-degrading endonuclease toxin of MazEF toxin-antitoxin module